jgi:hypothetical protein
LLPAHNKYKIQTRSASLHSTSSITSLHEETSENLIQFSKRGINGNLISSHSHRSKGKDDNILYSNNRWETDGCAGDRSHVKALFSWQPHIVKEQIPFQAKLNQPSKLESHLISLYFTCLLALPWLLLALQIKTTF